MIRTTLLSIFAPLLIYLAFGIDCHAEPASSPSKQETLAAISDIYTNLNARDSTGSGCEVFKMEVQSSPGTFIGSYADLTNFSFSSDDLQIYFHWIRAFSQRKNGDLIKRYNKVEMLGLNPADFSTATFQNTQQVVFLNLFSADNTKNVRVPFCNQDAASRVIKAVWHLRQFYTPTKPLPF